MTTSKHKRVRPIHDMSTVNSNDVTVTFDESYDNSIVYDDVENQSYEMSRQHQVSRKLRIIMLIIFRFAHGANTALEANRRPTLIELMTEGSVTCLLLVLTTCL